MSVQRQRLLALIEYVQQSARMRTKVVSNVTDHGRFLLFEHQVSALDGIKLNDSGPDGDDEVWLSVPRPPGPDIPPQPESAWLAPWLNMGVALLVAPQLAESVEGAALIAAGTHRDATQTAASLSDLANPAIEPGQRVWLSQYDFRSEVARQYALYLERAWQPWAEAEQRRRRVSRLYVQLFTLKQELAGSMVDGQFELVWGLGLGVWKQGDAAAAYPLVTRQVDLAFDPETGAAQVRPRDVDPRLELDFYAAVDKPGVAQADRLAREFLAKATTTVSPFEPETYAPLLAIAKSCLDPDSGDGPAGEERLKLSTSWVLFARPRSTNVLIHDLENLARAAQAMGDDAALPGAVAALVTDPASEIQPVALPVFRGVSAPYDDRVGGQASDLYFPKVFNDEQVRIVQLLESHDGVVVQGPPGTGKTHTIANIICHWLAHGRRVLVTSMKEPALAVLREKLPEEIRPLAISLLAGDAEGMWQFEQAIHAIAFEVQSIDTTAAQRDLAKLEQTIQALHARLTRIDTDIGRWARLNLARIELDGESIAPVDAAREVAAAQDLLDEVPDNLGVGAQFGPRFGRDDLARLSEARRQLGADLEYAGSELPSPADFPDASLLLQAHHDLLRHARLTDPARTAEVPPLVDSTQQTLSEARALTADIERVRALRTELRQADASWIAGLRDRIRRGALTQERHLLEAVGADLEQAGIQRRAFLARPVSVPPPAQLGVGFVQAVDNLAQGKRPFGLGGMFRRAEDKRYLEAVRVGGHAAREAADWQHVSDYLALQKTWRELAARWNVLAPELGLPPVGTDDPGEGVTAAAQFALYRKLCTLVAAETALVVRATRLLPGWNPARRVDDDEQALARLEQAIGHHLTTWHLADVWAVRERLQQVTEGGSGPVIAQIRRFVTHTLGNAAVDDTVLLSAWSALMAELARLGRRIPLLQTVAEVARRIADSGAPLYARRLREQATGELVPDHVLRLWRLRRLAGHLAAIDAQDDFRKLTGLRSDLEHDLVRAYHEVVVRRTWLKLAENATPSVRAALQAYLNAIQRIGKGTGKRAVRYRQDARTAAAEANHAVPCWIMPHYRVSESLPAQLGCFDLVVIDEASQSDLSALPAMLRGRKLLIVGDDRQVSPDVVGLEEERIKALMQRHLPDQVPLYRAQMSAERSIYDLARVVFARSGVMLKEHFRCVAPIIEYSKREFYAHELRPLRLPRPSERLDPALVDVFVEDGERKGGVNAAEARFIVGEIRRLTADPRMANRSIGVVSLLGEDQAQHVWDQLVEELGPELLQRHAIVYGDARTFQGRERDVILLTMVCAPNDVGAPLTRDIFAQRFNVAASRARDRMYLVRSVGLEHLSEADRLRRGLIAHFAHPFEQAPPGASDPRDLCTSAFERELFDWLVRQGYRVTPQVRVGAYRIDLVVEGDSDARLAVECDGDKDHGPEQWADDVRRQRVLERAGWVFWRCFAATFLRRREAVLQDLARAIATQGIEPDGARTGRADAFVEFRKVRIGSGA